MLESIFKYSENSKYGLIRCSDNKEIGTRAYEHKNRKLMCITVKYRGKLYKVHRIIWEQQVGEIPDKYVIDHIDGNPANNKISNLRCIPEQFNFRNRSKSLNNTSGYNGVRFVVISGCLYAKAQITFNNKESYKLFSVLKFGIMPSFSLALKWRKDKEQELNTQQNAGFTERHGK